MAEEVIADGWIMSLCLVSAQWYFDGQYCPELKENKMQFSNLHLWIKLMFSVVSDFSFCFVHLCLWNLEWSVELCCPPCTVSFPPTDGSNCLWRAGRRMTDDQAPFVSIATHAAVRSRLLNVSRWFRFYLLSFSCVSCSFTFLHVQASASHCLYHSISIFYLFSSLHHVVMLLSLVYVAVKVLH